MFDDASDPYFGNECQAAELHNNGTVLLNARTLVLHREQAISTDGGLTFTNASKVRHASSHCAPVLIMCRARAGRDPRHDRAALCGAVLWSRWVLIR